jgi:hypothetical protein
MRPWLLPLLLVTALAVPAGAEEVRPWTTGDTWTWAQADSVDGGWESHALGPLTFREVKRSVAAAGSNVTREIWILTWAAPMRLAEEEKTTTQCVQVALGTQCGNVTDHWIYAPPLPLVQPPLADLGTWEQVTQIQHHTHDERTGLRTDTPTTQETRRFEVGFSGNFVERAGEFFGWPITMSNAAGRVATIVYSEETGYAIERWSYVGDQVQEHWTLDGFALGAPRPHPSPTPSGTASPGSTGGSRGTTGNIPGGARGGNATGSGSAPSGGTGAPGGATGGSGTAPAGERPVATGPAPGDPSKQRLRGLPAFEPALLVAALALLAAARRRSSR